MQTTTSQPPALASATQTLLSPPPAPCLPWPEYSGTYAGIAAANEEEGHLDAGHIILLHATPDQDLNWVEAVAWAQSQGEGARLPTRFESALLYANVRVKMDTTRWHWTGTQCSEGSAWGQDFSFGGQDGYGIKKYEARCRAVRRLPLQSFNPS